MPFRILQPASSGFRLLSANPSQGDFGGTPTGSSVESMAQNRRPLSDFMKSNNQPQPQDQMQTSPEGVSFDPKKAYSPGTAEWLAQGKFNAPNVLPNLENLGKGAVKGTLSTLNSASQLGQNLFRPINNAVLGAFGQKQPENVSLPQNVITPSNTAQKVGFEGEQFGEFLLPGLGEGSEAAKVGEKAAEDAPSFLEKLAKVGKSSVKGAAEMGGVSLAQQGKLNKDVITNAVIGGAFPVAFAGLKFLGGVGKEVAKYASSALSGVPADAIEHALQNPEAVQKAIKSAVSEGGDSTAQKIYNDAMDALDKLKKTRSSAFEEKLNNIKADTAGTKLSTQGVKDAAQKTLENFGGKLDNKGILNASEMAIDSSHANKLQEITNRINTWKDTSPTGINKLRQIIDGYKLGGINLGSSEAQFNKMVGALRTNLSDYLGEQVPAFRTMNSEYSAQSDVIDNIKNQLKTGSKDPNTALRKLLNVFNPKSTVYRPIVEELGSKGGKDLMSDIAGLIMSKWTPEGIGKYLSTAELGASVLNPTSLATVPATLAASSPRVVGELATRGSQLASKAGELPLEQGARTLKSLLAKKKY